MNLKIVLKVDGTGVTSRPGRETQETVWVDDEQIYVESKHDDDVDDEQIDLDKGSPPKITGFVWYCTKLVNPPTHPLKKRDLVQKNDFYHKFTGICLQNGVKYAIKTVIYKNLGPLNLTHPHLVQLYQRKPVIFGGASLTSKHEEGHTIFKSIEGDWQSTWTN